MGKASSHNLLKKAPVPSPRFNLKIHVTSLTELGNDQSLYITGAFNDWNPKDPASLLENQENGSYYIELGNLEAGVLEFKFTRGTWETVEGRDDVEESVNHTWTIQSDAEIYVSITDWKDLTGLANKRHSASPNVHIMDTAFTMPQLNRTRRIWVYLPEDYAFKKRKYPVLYMHDGQNLFDEFTAYSGEWGVDETLDSLKAQCIVIGIDNAGSSRINEYNCNDHPQFGKGEGRLYLEFVVETLKPYVDGKYRTLKGRRNTAIAGSSMGGLISFYAGLLYPRVFGRIGVFSPSFALSPRFREQIPALANRRSHSTQHYYFYGGGSESANMVSDLRLAADLTATHSRAKMEVVIREDGGHNEATWRAEFPGFYRWLINSMR